MRAPGRGSCASRQAGRQAGRKVGKQTGVWGARKTPRGGSSTSWSQSGWQTELECLRVPAPSLASRHAGIIGADKSEPTGSWEDAEDLSVSPTFERPVYSHLVSKHSQVGQAANTDGKHIMRWELLVKMRTFENGKADTKVPRNAKSSLVACIPKDCLNP